MVENYGGDAREECPDCGSKGFEIHRMGMTVYVLCNDGCQHSIIGELDPIPDELDPKEA